MKQTKTHPTGVQLGEPSARHVVVRNRQRRFDVARVRVGRRVAVVQVHVVVQTHGDQMVAMRRKIRAVDAAGVRQRRQRRVIGGALEFAHVPEAHGAIERRRRKAAGGGEKKTRQLRLRGQQQQQKTHSKSEGGGRTRTYYVC